MAKATFNASMTWSGKGSYCDGGTRGFQLAIDETVSLDGANKAMNLIELLLGSLGGFVSIGAAAFAKKCQVDLKGGAVDLEGDLDPAGFLGKDPNMRKGFQEIRYKIHIDSPSPQENIEELIALIEERCPIPDTLTGVEARRVA